MELFLFLLLKTDKIYPCCKDMFYFFLVNLRKINVQFFQIFELARTEK